MKVKVSSPGLVTTVDVFFFFLFSSFFLVLIPNPKCSDESFPIHLNILPFIYHPSFILNVQQSIYSSTHPEDAADYIAGIIFHWSPVVVSVVCLSVCACVCGFCQFFRNSRALTQKAQSLCGIVRCVDHVLRCTFRALCAFLCGCLQDFWAHS